MLYVTLMSIVWMVMTPRADFPAFLVTKQLELLKVLAKVSLVSKLVIL